MDYWKECIAEALEDSGLTATDKQIDNITAWVGGAYENYGLATGQECIPNPVESRAEVELRELKRENDKKEQWIINSKPCKCCNTTGVILDGWGRNVECMTCGGKGIS